MFYPLSDPDVSPSPGNADRNNIERLTAAFAGSPCQTETKDATASSAALELDQGKAVFCASHSSANARVQRDTAPAGGSIPRLVFRTLDDALASSLVCTERPELPHHEVVIRDFGDGVCELTAFRSDYMRPKNRGGKRVVGERRKRAEMSEDDLTRSISRAKRNMRHRVLMMRADRLLTLSYRENKTDLKSCWGDFARFLRSIIKMWPDFEYVVVPERQERGAVHFHMAIRGFRDVNILRYLWRRVLCGDGNASSENSPGNIDITSPRRGGQWQRARLSRYLSKYMGKDFLEGNMHARRFSSSCSIAAPEVTRFYLPLGDNTFYFLSRVMESVSPKGVQRWYEFSAPMPCLWMSSY
jgi:hypothetical protein